MQRTTGTGFIAFGLVLIVVGAILRFAVTTKTDGFDMATAGLIAIWAGVAALVIGLLLVLVGRPAPQHGPRGRRRNAHRLTASGGARRFLGLSPRPRRSKK